MHQIPPGWRQNKGIGNTAIWLLQNWPDVNKNKKMQLSNQSAPAEQQTPANLTNFSYESQARNGAQSQNVSCLEK